MQRPLLPKFLKKYDEHLLLHKPEAWSIRTHLVLYYGVLFMAALTLIAFLAPDDPREDSLSGIWAGFVSIVSIIGLVVWIIYLLRFNVFKRYGTIKPGSRLFIFLLYFIAAGIFVLFPYVPSFVESSRANRAYGDEEIVKDINAFNTAICRLEYDSLKHAWKRDTIKVVDEKPEPKAVSASYYSDTDVAVVAVERYGLLDTAELAERLLTSDSTIQLSDSLYVFLTCPDYAFLQVYNSDTYTREKELNDVGLYRRVIKNYTPPDKRSLKKEIGMLIKKYDIDISNSSHYYEDTSNYIQKIRSRYELQDVDNSINNIVRRKYRWVPDKLEWFYRSSYYIALALTLLIFIFRHSTAKTFFLSLLATLILTILTALLMAFTGYKETSFFAWIIGYFLLFFFITLLLWKSKVRNVVTGISINIFVFLVPLVPLMAVLYYYAVLKERRRYSAIELYDAAAMYTHLYYAELAGALLLLVMLGTYIQALYRKWYSLPEE